MSRYVDLPARGNLPAASLLARISTPLNRHATTVDHSHPTILLADPAWTDSFFFYPQYDEPGLFENYSLVCFDVRGHGETIIEPLGSGSFSASDAADDAFLALMALGVDHAHVLGVSVGGSSIAFHLARRHVDFVLSLTMISPHMANENPEWTLAFDELAELLSRAVQDEDADALDAVTIGAWNWGVGEGRGSSESISDLRQRFIDFQRTKLADGRLAVALPYHAGLLASRRLAPSSADVSTITCPVLILHGEEAAGLGLIEQYDDFAATLGAANASRHGPSRPAPASVICVGDEPQLMCLTSPHVVHPLILEHLAAAIIPYIESIPPSPMSAQFSRSSRASLSSISSISRRTSSPREMTGFSIPPPPKLGPGVLTLGQVLDREKQEGIPMTVEVMVTVDEGADGTTFTPDAHDA